MSDLSKPGRASKSQKLRSFYRRGGFGLLVELHREGCWDQIAKLFSMLVIEQPLARQGLLDIHFVISHEYLCCSPEIITVQTMLLWHRRPAWHIPRSLARRAHSRYLSDIQHSPHSRRARHVPKCRPSWWPQIMGQGDPKIVGWQSELAQESPGSHDPAPPPDDRSVIARAHLQTPDRRVGGRTNLGKMEERGQLLLCLSW